MLQQNKLNDGTRQLDADFNSREYVFFHARQKVSDEGK